MGIKEHKRKAPRSLDVGVITISTTRTIADDKSGQWICKQLKKENHNVVLHKVITDDARFIEDTVKDAIVHPSPRALILTGGTGISTRDVTIEAVRPMFGKELTSFGPIFAMLSFEEIYSGAILSRSTAGIIGKTVIFCIPGSLAACKLALNELILPELGHVAKHVDE